MASALDLAEGGGRKGTVVDLTALRFADSSLLHRLLEARRAHVEAGLALVLVRPGRVVERLLRVTGAYEFFTVADTVVDAAVAGVTPPPPEGGGFSLYLVGVETDQPGP